MAMLRKSGSLHSLDIRSVHQGVEGLVSFPLDKTLFNTVLLRVRTILSISNSVWGYTVTLTSS